MRGLIGRSRRLSRFALISGSGVTLPPFEALIAEMDVAPDATRQGHISTLIDSLVSAGVWDKLGMLHIEAAHDAQAASINWKDPSGPKLTPVNSPTFTVDRGYQGNGTSSYLGTGVNLASVPNYALDSATMFVWSLTDVSSTGRDIGTISHFNASIYGNSGGSNSVSRSNNAINSTVAFADSLGMYGWSRNEAAGYKIFKAGAVISSPVAASSAILDSEVTICRALSTYSPRQIAIDGVGAGLADTQWSDGHAAFTTYLTAVGAI